MGIFWRWHWNRTRIEEAEAEAEVKDLSSLRIPTFGNDSGVIYKLRNVHQAPYYFRRSIEPVLPTDEPMPYPRIPRAFRPRHYSQPRPHIVSKHRIISPKELDIIESWRPRARSLSPARGRERTRTIPAEQYSRSLPVMCHKEWDLWKPKSYYKTIVFVLTFMWFCHTLIMPVYHPLIILGILYFSRKLVRWELKKQITRERLVADYPIGLRYYRYDGFDKEILYRFIHPKEIKKFIVTETIIRHRVVPVMLIIFNALQTRTGVKELDEELDEYITLFTHVCPRLHILTMIYKEAYSALDFTNIVADKGYTIVKIDKYIFRYGKGNIVFLPDTSDTESDSMDLRTLRAEMYLKECQLESRSKQCVQLLEEDNFVPFRS